MTQGREIKIKGFPRNGDKTLERGIFLTWDNLNRGYCLHHLCNPYSLKAEDMNPVPGIHMLEGKTSSHCRLSSDLGTCTVICPYTQTCNKKMCVWWEKQVFCWVKKYSFTSCSVPGIVLMKKFSEIGKHMTAEKVILGSQRQRTRKGPVPFWRALEGPGSHTAVSASPT